MGHDPFKATIPHGFADFKHCIPCSDVDIENDEFILKLTGDDGVSKYWLHRCWRRDVLATSLRF